MTPFQLHRCLAKSAVSEYGSFALCQCPADYIKLEVIKHEVQVVFVDIESG
jgi:hypothetical protein